MEEIVVKCIKCEESTKLSSIEFKTTECSIEGLGKTPVVWYECPECKKKHIIAILDYRAKKLQEKYLNVRVGISKKLQSGVSVSDNRLKEMQNLKKGAEAYQNEILHKYRDLVPEQDLV